MEHVRTHNRGTPLKNNVQNHSELPDYTLPQMWKAKGGTLQKQRRHKQGPCFWSVPFHKTSLHNATTFVWGWVGWRKNKKKTAKTRNKLTHIPHMYCCTADTPYIRFRKKKKTTSSAALVTVGVDWCVVGVQAEFACCTWHRVRLSCSRGL